MLSFIFVIICSFFVSGSKCLQVLYRLFINELADPVITGCTHVFRNGKQLHIVAVVFNVISDSKLKNSNKRSRSFTSMYYLYLYQILLRLLRTYCVDLEGTIVLNIETSVLVL